MIRIISILATDWLRSSVMKLIYRSPVLEVGSPLGCHHGQLDRIQTQIHTQITTLHNKKYLTKDFVNLIHSMTRGNRKFALVGGCKQRWQEASEQVHSQNEPPRAHHANLNFGLLFASFCSQSYARIKLNESHSVEDHTVHYKLLSKTRHYNMHHTDSTKN